MRPDFSASTAVQMAAEPVAQAFSQRTAGVWRNAGMATAGSAAVKSCGTKPALKWPTKMPSISSGASPALSSAGSAASRISCSRSTASSLPKGVWPQPVMRGSVVMGGLDEMAIRTRISALNRLPRNGGGEV